MQWTMPHRVLQVVAGLIGLAAITSFSLGVINAPQRGGRLPGEKVPGASGQAAIEASDATPLSDERIQGPPPPSPAETANQETQTEADAGEIEPAVKPTPDNTPPLLVVPPKIVGAPPEPTGQTLGGPPAPDEPPH